MREQGTTDVRFTDIARVMGMTPPALYRYFDDRDELLTALIADALRRPGRAGSPPRATPLPSRRPGRPLGRGGQAYRDWARSEPQQFALILGMPVPGYVAPEEGPTTEAAKARDGPARRICSSRAAESGRLGEPLIREVSQAIVDCANDKHPELDGIVPPESFQAMMHAWATLHGFVSLEAYGHFDWMEPDARDALFRSHIRLAAKAAGLPVPPP